MIPDILKPWLPLPCTLQGIELKQIVYDPEKNAIVYITQCGNWISEWRLLDMYPVE